VGRGPGGALRVAEAARLAVHLAGTLWRGLPFAASRTGAGDHSTNA